MLIKTIIVIAFLLILFSLGSALFYLIKGNQSAKTVKVLKALSFRIGLSVFLFIFIVLTGYFGAIQPHGIRPDVEKLEAAVPTK